VDAFYRIQHSDIDHITAFYKGSDDDKETVEAKENIQFSAVFFLGS